MDWPHSCFVAEIGESPTLVELVDIAPVALVVVGSRLSHAALLASSSYDTCHKPFQVPPALVPISQHIFHPYNDRQGRTGGKSVVLERSSVDTHRAPTRGFGGEKGSQLNYLPYSNYWPYLWRYWISLLGVRQLPGARRYEFDTNAFLPLVRDRDTSQPLSRGTESGRVTEEGE